MSSGFLVINSTAAQRIIPVQNTRIIISQANEDDKEYMTDDSGKTTLIEIAAPDIVFSEAPDPSQIPFSVVDITVEKEGFFTTVIRNVQIFPERTTTQYVNMVPVPEYGENTPLNVDVPPQNL